MRKYLALTSLVLSFCFLLSITNLSASGDEKTEAEETGDKKQESLPLLVLSSKDHEPASAAFREHFSGEVRMIVFNKDEKKKAKQIKNLGEANPPLAVVMGNEAGRAVKERLAGVPLVYASARSAKKISLSKQKAYGIYHEPSPRDQLRAMRRVFPQKKDLLLLYAPQCSPEQEDRLKRLARAQGFDLTAGPCKDVKEVPEKVKSLLPEAGLVWVLTDGEVLGPHNNRFITMQSMSAKVPVFCGDARLGRSGAVAALVPSPDSVGKLAAKKAEKLAKGKTPDAGDITYPEGELIINRKMARAINAEISPEVLEKAAQVIK